jgi:hypothetical protein
MYNIRIFLNLSIFFLHKFFYNDDVSLYLNWGLYFFYKHFIRDNDENE